MERHHPERQKRNHITVNYEGNKNKSLLQIDQDKLEAALHGLGIPNLPTLPITVRQKPPENDQYANLLGVYNTNSNDIQIFTHNILRVAQLSYDAALVQLGKNPIHEPYSPDKDILYKNRLTSNKGYFKGNTERRMQYLQTARESNNTERAQKFMQGLVMRMTENNARRVMVHEYNHAVRLNPDQNEYPPLADALALGLPVVLGIGAGIGLAHGLDDYLRTNYHTGLGVDIITYLTGIIGGVRIGTKIGKEIHERQVDAYGERYTNSLLGSIAINEKVFREKVIRPSYKK